MDSGFDSQRTFNKNDYVWDTLKDFKEDMIWDKPISNYIQLKYNSQMEWPKYNDSKEYKKKYGVSIK